MAIPTDPSVLASEIKSLALEAGYTACGITTAEPFEDYRAALDEHVRRFPETAPLYSRMKGRIDPKAENAWARSIVVCIRAYGKYRLPKGAADHIGRNYLCDRRSPKNPDNAMSDRMSAGLRRLGVRARKGGVPDRAAAARAGLARVGRNNFAYTAHGSWVNIECWVTAAELAADAPAAGSPCPENCRACLRACPTGALCAPYMMRMDRCTAYLTFRAPHPIAPELWAKMGPWIYGCDACQNACPLNRGKWEEREPAPWLEGIAGRLTPEALATMDEETYRARIHPLFGYIAIEDVARWHANARRAAECADARAVEGGGSRVEG